jgi:8-oxo-dGTP pyrophosphatase MutT (NUDIX family)
MRDSSRSLSDADLGVPGDERLRLALDAAVEAASSVDASFETRAWRAVAELDEAAGFETRLAARAVLRRERDDRVLLFRYVYGDGTVRLVIPGGGAEAGETPSQAAAREVFEETGTHARELRPSGLVICHLLRASDSFPQPRVQYSPIYLGTIDDELPHTDGREERWVSLTELEALPAELHIRAPLVEVLRAEDRGETLEPHVVWLPS